MKKDPNITGGVAYGLCSQNKNGIHKHRSSQNIISQLIPSEIDTIARHIREKQELQGTIKDMARQAELERNRMSAEITSLTSTVEKLQSEIQALKRIERVTPCSADGHDTRRIEKEMTRFLDGLRIVFDSCDLRPSCEVSKTQRQQMIRSFHPDKYLHTRLKEMGEYLFKHLKPVLDAKAVTPGELATDRS